ncbi:MAG: Ig-like domain-containing protein [Planctomycetota bacterium]|jgi:hypothetical protein
MPTTQSKTNFTKLFYFVLWICIFNFAHMIFLPARSCPAVTSKITRQATSVNFLKGQNEDVVIDSKGTIKLGLSGRTAVEKFEDVWSINSIIETNRAIFIGTSPNGGIYKYSHGILTKIYPQEKSPVDASAPAAPVDTNAPADANVAQADKIISNEHIFVMKADPTGRVLAGVSGDKARLMSYEKGQMEIIFEPNDVRYIFDIAIDDNGVVYLATGPQGKIYRIDSTQPGGEVIYQSRDKNILSLAIDKDGLLYAGSDSRGLIYRIDPKTKRTTVLYDSDQPEITALVFAEDGQLYAAATSAQITKSETRFAAQLPLAGRPETKDEKPDIPSEANGGLKLKIANTKEAETGKPPQGKPPAKKRAKPAKASYIYKITPDGFVTDVFQESVVLFSLKKWQDKLLIGTGNNGQLFTVEPPAEKQAVIYEDKQASQITSLLVTGQKVYLGTANPARLIILEDIFAFEGTYTSDLIDAGQPAKWGKLQIEADIPPACKVMVASRSGNVKDINDATFSQWTEVVEIDGPVQLGCPQGRFCQYKLILKSLDGLQSPIVREVAVAHTVPNLAPKVESVTVIPAGSAEKSGVFKISYKAADDNNDRLVYKIDFRKLDWTGWIQLEEEKEDDNFQLDGQTLEDGRYEIRVTVSDEKSNTTATKLTGSRISEPVVVDNSPPEIMEHATITDGCNVTLTMKLFDLLSVIDSVEYTIDSKDSWKAATPEDGIYDTTEEDFVVTIQALEEGEHIITVKASDAAGNTRYKTLKININAKN